VFGRENPHTGVRHGDPHYRGGVPFTLAHPAAVLPLRRVGLPLAAMVCGSMTPDVPLFVRGPFSYGFTHSLLGVVTADLALAITALAAWCWVLRDAVVDLSPAMVRERLPPRARYSVRQWALVVPAAVIGSFSHVSWDAFTHRGRWGVERIGWLHTTHGWFAGYQWAQYASGAAGLAVVALWAGEHLGRLPRRARPRRVSAPGTRLLLGAAAAVTVTAAVTAGSQAPAGLHAMAYRGAVWGTAALVAGVCLLSLTWQVAVRAYGPPGGGDPAPRTTGDATPP
jgi:membrane-bound metal-dependent hydrolase YbcI (DUF457 family)